MDIINFDDIIPQDFQINYIQKHFLAPEHPFSLLLIGPSSGGKTNIVMNLIFRYLYFDKLYILVKDKTEDKYRFIEQIFGDIEAKIQEMADNGKEFFGANETQSSSSIERDNISQSDDEAFTDESEYLDEKLKILHLYDNAEEFPSCDDLNKLYQSLIIFDDQVTEGTATHKIVEELFIRGRKKNASMIYISQSYYDIPKLIRLNANYIILLGVNDRKELLELSKNHATRIDRNEFIRLYQEAVKEPYSFLLIDKKTQFLPLHIRKGFDELYKQS